MTTLTENEPLPTPNGDDQRLREQALDPAKSFLVEAPAGSGKTGLLVMRALRLLAEIKKPERLLAITFTRKAAAEMRERILAAVAAPAGGDEASDPFLRDLAALGKRVRARADREWGGPEALAARLRIETIDALCRWIVRQAPLAGPLGEGTRMLEEHEAEALFREAAEAALAATEHAGEVAELLRRYGGDAARLRADLARLLGIRERFRGLLGTDAQARDSLKDALRQHLGAELGALDTALSPFRDGLLKALRYAGGKLEKLGRNHPFRDPGSAWPALRAEDLPKWRALADLCLTRDEKDPDFRSQLTKREGFPTKKDGGDERVKEDTLRLLGAMRSVPGLRERLARLRLLPEPAVPEESWQATRALLGLLRQALAELKLRFAERGVADFTEVALAALEALGTPEQPSELLLRLDRDFHHILVDEFQDSSELQVELLERLTAGWQQGDGRSLFLVGDPMQSIYRFRKAEVGLFLGLRAARRLGSVALAPLVLSRNFRSRPRLVERVNEVFARILPEEDRIGEGRARMRKAVAARDGKGEIAIRAIRPAGEGGAGGDAEEQAALAEACAWIEERRTSGGVAVLVRARDHARPLLRALAARGIPVHAPEFEPLGEQPLVADLAALALALSHPAERTAWLGVLRAPWCGLDQADLAALSASLPPGKPLWPHLVAAFEAARQSSLPAAAETTDEALAAPPDGPAAGVEAVRAALSEAGRARLQSLIETLRPIVEAAFGVPLRERLEAAWLALGGPACAREARELEDAERFLAWLESLGETPAIADVEGFLAGLKRLRAAARHPPEGAVTVLTLHQAKGLEFDHVLLFGLGRRVGYDTRPLLLVSSVVIAGRERPLLALAPPPGENDPVYEFLWRGIERPREAAERERLLYVGMTRARESMLLVLELEEPSRQESRREPRPAPGSLGEALWNALGDSEREELLRTGWLWRPAWLPQVRADALPAPAPSPAPPRGTADGLPPLRRIFGVERPDFEGLAGIPPRDEPAPSRPPFEWAEEPARLAGVLFHRLLARIADDGAQGLPERLPDSLRAALETELGAAGLAEREAKDDALGRIEEALKALRSDPKCGWLLADHGGSGRSELELLERGEDGGLRRHRIDRTFVDENGVRWIVDFKLARHEGGKLEDFLASERERYAGQLRRYAGLYAHEGRPVRAALFYPLLPEGHRLQEIPLDPPGPA